MKIPGTTEHLHFILVLQIKNFDYENKRIRKTTYREGF